MSAAVPHVSSTYPSNDASVNYEELTLQSRHFPYGFVRPLIIPLAYGEALARLERSLFSPIFRVEEDGWNGSGAARTETFCGVISS